MSADRVAMFGPVPMSLVKELDYRVLATRPSVPRPSVHLSKMSKHPDFCRSDCPSSFAALSGRCGLDGPPVAVAEEHTSCPDWWPMGHPAHCGPALNSGFPVQIATISFCDNEPSRRQAQPAGCCGVLVQNGYGDPHNARPIYHFGILSDSDSDSESKIGIALNPFPASVPHLHQDGIHPFHPFALS
ncbi:GD14397 [Drosophila simulans]|uniref:GD14397 n=1 Tax=Drosophila simulans TaxID=7240 RepID=B4QRQ4_DROSI|nr:GD14397 [Drosophila simulans]